LANKKIAFPLDPLLYGSCYFPEHWDPKMHEPDLKRMAQSGFNFVRMGEGAWSYFEPREGEFQFALFDRVLDLCKKYKIKAIMGTPTYAAPAWVAKNYPEALRWDFNRKPMGHGGRRHLNYTSAEFLGLSDRICGELAAHYKGHPQIVGWQLDNEFNCHMDVSYAPSDTLAFREWLKARYGSLDKLNAAWGSAFWSQTYGAWDEIDLPKPVPAYPNPSQVVDESRFISDTVAAFARRQAAIMKAANPKWFVTHNGLFTNVKGPDLVKELDFFAHDQYPGFYPHWADASFGLAQARSLSFPFALLEQQSGPGGQMAYILPTLRPGQQRLFAWESMAHGAGLMSYFLWRTVPYGSEQHWHGLLDADNIPGRRLAEAEGTCKEVRSMPKAFWSAAPARQAAVLRDYDNESNDWRANTYTGKGRNETGRWHKAMSKAHIGLDQVWESSDWSGYRLMVAPHLKMLSPQLAARLKAWVEKGGHLLLGAQSGSKDVDTQQVAAPYPGLLRGLAGVEVEDWSTLKDGEEREALWEGGSGASFALSTFVERLKPQGAEVLARWDTPDSLLAGAPALTRRKLKQGSVWYLGGYAQDAALDFLVERLSHELGLAPPAQAGEDVEMILRKAGKKSWLVLMNHAAEARTVEGLPEARLLVGPGALKAGALELPPFGVAILESQA
jgi:beta-galactosidase